MNTNHGCKNNEIFDALNVLFSKKTTRHISSIEYQSAFAINDCSGDSLTALSEPNEIVKALLLTPGASKKKVYFCRIKVDDDYLKLQKD